MPTVFQIILYMSDFCYITLKWNNLFLDAADTANDTEITDADESRKSATEILPTVSSEKPDLKPSKYWTLV